MNSDKKYRVGDLSNAQPNPTQYEPDPFRKSRPPEPLRFDVNMTAEANSRQKKAGVIQVNIPEPRGH